MPLVNDVSEILVVQIVGKVGGGAWRTKYRHKTGVVAAFLHVDGTVHNQDQDKCNKRWHQFWIMILLTPSLL